MLVLLMRVLMLFEGGALRLLRWSLVHVGDSSMGRLSSALLLLASNVEMSRDERDVYFPKNAMFTLKNIADGRALASLSETLFRLGLRDG